MGKFFALLPRICKVLASYLDPATGYPDKHGVLSSRPGTQMPGYHIKIGHENLHIIYSWITINLPINWYYITASADRVAARSKAWVCGHSLAGIAGSNSAGGMDVCLWWLLCVVRQRSLRRADHSCRGVLPSVVCLSGIVKPWIWKVVAH